MAISVDAPAAIARNLPEERYPDLFRLGAMPYATIRSSATPSVHHAESLLLHYSTTSYLPKARPSLRGGYLSTGTKAVKAKLGGEGVLVTL